MAESRCGVPVEGAVSPYPPSTRGSRQCSEMPKSTVKLIFVQFWASRNQKLKETVTTMSSYFVLGMTILAILGLSHSLSLIHI